jgi:hypothetical protein
MHIAAYYVPPVLMQAPLLDVYACWQPNAAHLCLGAKLQVLFQAHTRPGTSGHMLMSFASVDVKASS